MSDATPAPGVPALDAPGRWQAPLRLLPRAFGEAILPLLPRVGYTLRTVLACGLALWVAFFLQLQSPMSSVTTVLIVANPVSGALVSKSLWRFFATVLGASASVVLMALFAQSPLLFTLALSVCIGIACAVSTLLRFFRAYAAVLSGYTIIIVSSGAFSNPLHIFESALSRVSAVTDGVVCTALVFLLTTLPRPSTLQHTIETLVRDTARGFVQYRRGGPEEEAEFARTLPRAALVARMSALDEQIEYASADNYEIRRRTPRLRRGAARLLGLLSMLEPLHDQLRGASAEADAAQERAHRTMARLAELPPGGLAASLGGIIEDLRHVEALGEKTSDPASVTMVLHERDLLLQLSQAVADLTGVRSPADVRTKDAVRFAPYLEWAMAGRNALRGFLVTLIGGIFWYMTQWTAGPTMLSYLVPAACLLSTSPSASQASLRFALGTISAVPAAIIFEVLLLPRIDGFPLLWACITLCVLPGIWNQVSPRYAQIAFGYCVFFNAMVAVQNPITFNDIGLLNTWLAFLLGGCWLVVVFRVLLPTNPRREVSRLCISLARAVEWLAWRRPSGRLLPRWEGWQHLQMQKLLRLIQRLRQVPELVPTQFIQQASASIALGRTVMTLQELAVQEPSATLAREALAAIRGLRHDPAATAQRLRALGEAARLQLGERDVPSVGLQPMRLLVGSLGEAALLLDRAADLLSTRAMALA